MKKACTPKEELDYIGMNGFYDTAAAFAVSAFFGTCSEKTLVHINRNTQGQYVIILCSRG